MRFIAKLKDANLFLKVIQTVEKIDKQCTIHLTTKKIQFILVKELEQGFQVWSAMNASSLFNEYLIESKADNEISFSINLSHLARALKCGEKSTNQEILIKLTKKGDIPYLSLSMEVSPTRSMMLTQEIPIQFLYPEQMRALKEPTLPDPNIVIMMPNLQDMRNVIERMKDLDSSLTIQANMRGELTLKVLTDAVAIVTLYRNLVHPQVVGLEITPETIASAKVDIKKFWSALYSYHVAPLHAICCIVDGTKLVLHVLLDDLYITYYIPILT